MHHLNNVGRVLQVLEENHVRNENFEILFITLNFFYLFNFLSVKLFFIHFQV